MTEIEQIANELRMTWNEAATPGREVPLWPHLDIRDQNAYLAVAQKALELCGPKTEYRLLERGVDAIVEGDEWRNPSYDCNKWEPVTSKYWIGQKDWNVTAAFRRKVVAPNDHTECATIHAGSSSPGYLNQVLDSLETAQAQNRAYAKKVDGLQLQLRNRDNALKTMGASVVDLQDRLNDAQKTLKRYSDSYNECAIERDQAVANHKAVMEEYKLTADYWSQVSSFIHENRMGVVGRTTAQITLEVLKSLEDKNATIARLRQKLKAVDVVSIEEHRQMKDKLSKAATYIEALERDVALLSDAAREDLGVEMLKNQRDNWESTANQHLRNEQYYRGLLIQIGELFGIYARICDDGGLSEDVLVGKVPELVENILLQFIHE